jgi:hypothetical protein
VPVVAGSVIVVVVAFVDCSVALPLDDPVSTIVPIIFPYNTTQREPEEMVTTTPVLIVIGPVDIAPTLAGNV